MEFKGVSLDDADDSVDAAEGLLLGSGGFPVLGGELERMRSLLS